MCVKQGQMFDLLMTIVANGKAYLPVFHHANKRCLPCLLSRLDKEDDIQAAIDSCPVSCIHCEYEAGSVLDVCIESLAE